MSKITSHPVQLKLIQLGLAFIQPSCEGLLPAIQFFLTLAQQALVLPQPGRATFLCLGPCLAFCKPTLLMSD